MKLLVSQLLSAQSLVASVNSSAAEIGSYEGISVQSTYTGTPTGTLKLQCSNDGVTFSDVPTATVSLAGAAGSTLWNIPDAYYRFVRISYTATSGTGSVTSVLVGKGAH